MDTSRDTELYPAVSRSAAVHDRLKRELLAGSHPLSVRLAEERLARAFDVSRTPVREALSRLHTEGLVERHPDGGYAPAVPDLDAIVELYEVRAVLERAAVARGPHDVAALEELAADWEAMAGDLDSFAADPEFVLVDEDFHVRLASASGNRSLATMLAGLNERIRIVRMHDFLTGERIEATIEQHLGIVRAVIAGDTMATTRLLDEHLAESAAVVHERAAAAIARMLTARRESGT